MIDFTDKFLYVMVSVTVFMMGPYGDNDRAEGQSQCL